MDLGQILTDFLDEHRRRKLLAGSGGELPLEIFLDFYSFKSPFQGFQVIQTGFQLGKAGFLLIINIFIMKNVTDFCKTVETGVDLHLPLSFVKQ